MVALRHLYGAGYRVDLAENGQQAIEAYKRNRYDIILMDVQMPIMDGYEATKTIRKLEQDLKAQRSEQKRNNGSDLTDRPRRIPIISMTAHTMKGDKEKCLKAGMDDYIAKPLKHRELLAMIEKWTKPALYPPYLAQEDPGMVESQIQDSEMDSSDVPFKHCLSLMVTELSYWQLRKTF